VTISRIEGECPVCGATTDAHDIDSEAVAAEHKANLEAAEGVSRSSTKHKGSDDLRGSSPRRKSTRNDLEDAAERLNRPTPILKMLKRVDEVESTLEEDSVVNSKEYRSKGATQRRNRRRERGSRRR